ncbi:MAG: hypothetical protein OXG44_07920 [Gammaproteobacteria bacterium]|nr:hypothetical protein [Gammaproteobacteria bacterium]
MVMEEEVRRQNERILKRPDRADKKDPERLAQTYLKQIVVNRDFRELAEFLKSIRYLHIVPHLVRDPERSIGKHDDPFGGDFLEKVASTPVKTRDARLRNINKALKIAIPQFDSLTRSRTRTRVVRGGRHRRSGGRPQALRCVGRHFRHAVRLPRDRQSTPATRRIQRWRPLFSVVRALRPRPSRMRS